MAAHWQVYNITVSWRIADISTSSIWRGAPAGGGEADTGQSQAQGTAETSPDSHTSSIWRGAPGGGGGRLTRDRARPKVLQKPPQTPILPPSGGEPRAGGGGWHGTEPGPRYCRNLPRLPYFLHLEGSPGRGGGEADTGQSRAQGTAETSPDSHTSSIWRGAPGGGGGRLTRDRAGPKVLQKPPQTPILPPSGGEPRAGGGEADTGQSRAQGTAETSPDSHTSSIWRGAPGGGGGGGWHGTEPGPRYCRNLPRLPYFLHLEGSPGRGGGGWHGTEPGPRYCRNLPRLPYFLHLEGSPGRGGGGGWHGTEPGPRYCRTSPDSHTSSIWRGAPGGGGGRLTRDRARPKVLQKPPQTPILPPSTTALPSINPLSIYQSLVYLSTPCLFINPLSIYQSLVYQSLVYLSTPYLFITPCLYQPLIYSHPLSTY